MKKKISQEELSNLRKKEQARREMEYELRRDLKLGGKQEDIREKSYSNHNRLGIAAINFFGTLFIQYIIYFIILFKIRYFFRFFFDIHVEYASYVWSLQIFFWIAAFWSVYLKRSILDTILQKYTDFMT
ncbi:MAG: hypothetical protein ED557_12700 [Balneola sp.]|nr:MAG: hypothetical protein ED557_12700 [Balneola sp.]